MEKIQLLKEKLLVINEKLNMEKIFQEKLFLDTPEFRQSLENEISLFSQKKQILEDLGSELESQLNI